MYSLTSRKLLSRITERWPIKVLSVAAALILLVFHRMSTLETRVFYSPLQLETSEEMTPVGSHLKVIKVSIRGEPNSIYPILEEDIEIYLDLTNYTKEDLYQVPVQIRRKGSALGAGPLEISVDPLEVSLQLERRISRNITLTPIFRGTIAAGYELTGQTLNPSRVVAVGPRSVMESVTSFQTDIIDLEGRNEDFRVTANIINQDPFITIRGNSTTEFHGVVRRYVQIIEVRQWQESETEETPELETPDQEESDQETPDQEQASDD